MRTDSRRSSLTLFSVLLGSTLAMPLTCTFAEAAAGKPAGSSETDAAGPAPVKAAPGTPARKKQASKGPVPSTKNASQPAGAAASTLGVWFRESEGFFVPVYYDSFRGLDLSSLDPTQRERFVHWVNTELCTCAQTGCNRDTIANCYTHDLTCPRAPVRIREILELVRQGVPVPGSATIRAAPSLSAHPH